MAVTDTQQAAQFSADAAVSAAEAKQYLLEAQQGYQDTSKAAQEALDAAAAAATSEQNSSVSEISAAQSAEDALSAKNDAEMASSDATEYAKNKFTFYKTASDPDGTIAGLAATNNGQSFWVAQGPGSISAYNIYENQDGVAVLQAKQPGTAAITETVRQFPTLSAAQDDAAAGNILDGAKCWVTNTADGNLADEYINNGGTLDATGRSMPSQYAMYAPNTITNSRASDSEKLPLLFTGAQSGGTWSPASAEMAVHGAVQSVPCPARSSTSDPTVNYVFQQDISFASGGQYLAVSYLFRGTTELIFRNLQPASSGTLISSRADDLGDGTYSATAVYRLTGVGPGVAQYIYFGCQQRGASTTACEIAYPQMAVSDRPIFGVGGDMSLADRLNISGVIAPNLVPNSYADPQYQMPRLRVGSIGWTQVSAITDATIATALTNAGAVSCLVAPPVASGYTDALVEPFVYDTIAIGQYAAAQFYVYVAPGSGLNARDEISKTAVFFADQDGATAQITPDIISAVSANLFKVRATYRFTAQRPRRVSMGVRQTSAVSTFYVFGFFLACSGQPIRDILESPSRDTGFNERVDGNARNIAFNPYGDTTQQLLPLFGTDSAWTPVANLPTAVQMISQLGAKAALPAMRVESGYTDALVNVNLDGVKAGEYVAVEFSVYVNADSGVDPASVLGACRAFFWLESGGFTQVVATIKSKVSANVYVMQASYQYTQNATRVYLGARNTFQNADLYVFNFFAASSATPILNITKGLVRDPQLASWVNGLIVNPYPPLLAVNTPITGAEDLILLPDQVFAHPTAPLILQCNQLLMNWTADTGKFLDWSIRGTAVSGQPYSYETSRTLEIDPAKTGTSVRISFHNRQKPAQWSSRDMSILRGPASVSASKRIALIGDSLTNRGQVARLSTLLTAAGVTVSQIGTMSQAEGGNGEGRESWAAAHFVGKRTLLGSTRINISSDNPSSTEKNPFLFEATEAQKTANPAMCFLNTGAVSELSYADTQTGTFYTFDYRRYLDAQGFADPDIVSIALAWNDQAIGQTPDAYIAQINYMVSQIKVACPNARIAIAPYCVTTQSRAVWNATVSQYVRNVIGAFKGRQAEKLHIIPSWGIMPADTAWSSDGSSITRDAMTGSYVDTHNDGIHWDTWGRQYMAYNCLYPFYIWACAQ
ncbi:SGNH/GDSL hydrolase family protein [Raoultella sp. BIGb0138]|uniref:SGNH/GDSL hydrolase family protein n=1 Tax=Raoultella sp. BIGb0138 TaxID=2485115 RepID=UPI0010453C8A